MGCYSLLLPFYFKTDPLLTFRTSCVCVVRTPLHSAAYSGNVAGLQLVIDQGAEVNSVDQRGYSALMVAAERGQTRAVGVWGKERQKAHDYVLHTL